jgi:hypothetical protein
MRINSEAGTITHYSYATVAVTPRASLSVTQLEQRFTAAGYVTYGPTHPTSSTRSDRKMLSVCRVVQSAENRVEVRRSLPAWSGGTGTITHATGEAMRQTAVETITQFVFGELMQLNRRRRQIQTIQPVWNVARWTDSGFALRVVDDQDATEQLDALAEALEIARDLITINPVVGWQGYGHPTLLEP